MNTKDLDKIASDLIASKIAHGEEVQMEWAVHEIIKSQGTISGEGVDFYAFCARAHCYRVVKKAVDKYETRDEGDPNQLNMAGFDYLQVAYTIERENERVLVPIDHLSAADLLARASEFDKQAKGLRAHAKEIRLYVAKRENVSDSVAQ